MKILITGGGGLLGQYLNIELSKDNDILTLYHQNIGNCLDFKSMKADITDFLFLEKIFKDFLPDIVIHNAAISNPHTASNLDPKIVYDINVNSTKKFAELCEKYKAKLIYTSSDLVYAGYRGSMLKEDAKLIPISLYAETKLMGEVKIQQTFDNFTILRVALLYGFGLNHSKNHFHEMYDNFKNNRRVKLFYDQFRTPISLIEIAKVISNLCNINLKNEIINTGGKERIARIELGEILCDEAGFDKTLIDRISMNEFKDSPMVADVSMNTDKLQSYGIKLKSIEESIKEIL
ncbi:MAG TPA: sugar nucleotide-binding protein [Ignavibacteriaceae bacterium]|nr:sugar nucleotide-binding protein [Ignavibacteriaceae bacterium]